MKAWLEQGAPKNKLNVGIPFYGRSFKINGNLNTFKYGDPAAGGGSVGSYTGEMGFLSYYEVNILANIFSTYMMYIMLPTIVNNNNNSVQKNYEIKIIC